MDQVLQEFVDSRGVAVRIDRQQGVIRGVKLLGLESRNRRTYSPDALAQAVGLYEGAKVNVNHPKGHPLAARDYQDRIGVIRNVVVRPGAGLFGDFHFNPKHALAEQLLWDAEHAPENVGFSHNVLARTARQGENTVVEAIVKVQGVDLVADPATSRGLFESQAAAEEAAPAAAAAREWLAALTLDELAAQRPDLVEAALQPLGARLDAAQEELASLRASAALAERRELARRLLGEYQLPDPEEADADGRGVVGPEFLETLLAAPDETALRRLLEQRAQLVRSAGRWAQRGPRAEPRPLSREQRLVDVRLAPVLDAAAFARAIS